MNPGKYTSYRIDPEAGLVYGLRGKPMTGVRGGYIKVSHGSRFTRSVHHMIWEAVHGPIPDGFQINHINGNKLDNRICNLELLTPSENTAHAYRLGLRTARGEKNGRAIGKARQLAQGRVTA